MTCIRFGSMRLKRRRLTGFSLLLYLMFLLFFRGYFIDITTEHVVGGGCFARTWPINR